MSDERNDGILADVERAIQQVSEQGIEPRVYVVSPQEYEREVERELGIVRRRV